MAAALRRRIAEPLGGGVAAILAQQVPDAQALVKAAAQEQVPTAEQPAVEMQPWHMELPHGHWRWLQLRLGDE